MIFFLSASKLMAFWPLCIDMVWQHKLERTRGSICQMYLKKKNSWLIKLILHTGIYRARQSVKYNTVLLNSVEGFQWSCCCKSRTYREKTSKFRKNKIRNSCKIKEYFLKATEFQKISYTERLCTFCTYKSNFFFSLHGAIWLK